MKNRLLILCIAIFSLSSYGQTSSSVRTVFGLQGGDSLQYHIWTTAHVCQTICNVYKWYVVDTVFPPTAGDSLTVWFHSTETHMDTLDLTGAPCAPACYHDVQMCLPGSSSARSFTLAYADSAVDSTSARWHYSIDKDSLISYPAKYGGYKQHVIYWGDNIMAAGVDIFVDSLGVAYHEIPSYEFSNAQNQELIYYHKANGKTWGQRYTNVGIHDLAQDQKVSIYPNPTSGQFTIYTDQYRGAAFELYDQIGQRVYSHPLTSPDTQVETQYLARGIYQWRITFSDHGTQGRIAID